MALKISSEAPKRGLPATHPGELLREDVLPALKAAGVAKTRVADDLGVSRRTLYDLLEEKQVVTPDMALRLGKYFGNAPEFWLNMQHAWDLERARVRLGAELEKIPACPAA